MNSRNVVYIKSVDINEIPWKQLTTTYGRATEFPELFLKLPDADVSIADKVLEQIEINIEHQDTLWHATPFTMIFLARIFKDVSQSFLARKDEKSRFYITNLLDLFILIATCYKYGNEMEHDEPLAFFEDMLKEEYLWSEIFDEVEDEVHYEGYFFPDNLFYSFYYYSYEVLLCYKEDIEILTSLDDFEIKQRVLELLKLLS